MALHWRNGGRHDAHLVHHLADRQQRGRPRAIAVQSGQRVDGHTNPCHRTRSWRGICAGRTEDPTVTGSTRVSDRQRRESATNIMPAAQSGSSWQQRGSRSAGAVPVTLPMDGLCPRSIDPLDEHTTTRQVPAQSAGRTHTLFGDPGILSEVGGGLRVDARNTVSFCAKFCRSRRRADRAFCCLPSREFVVRSLPGIAPILGRLEPSILQNAHLGRPAIDVSASGPPDVHRSASDHAATSVLPHVRVCSP